MHYVKKFDINGIETRQVACIELHGKPNAATEGAVGVLGVDLDSSSHQMYVCIAVNGAIHTWIPVTNGGSGGTGADGITPHIGANGNWYLGDEDTGVCATGTHVVSVEEVNRNTTLSTYRMNFSDDKGYEFTVYHGQDGKDGAYVTGLEEMAGDATRSTYRMEFSDGKGYDFDVFHGAKGDKGDTGVTPKFTADEIITLPAGSSAYVTIHNDDPENPVIDFGIPQGATGATGKSAYAYAKDGGYTGTEAEFGALLANATDKRKLSLGIASDGLIYVYVDGTPVGDGIPQGQSGDVFGYVDENNTVVLTGNLANGTYTIKYEVEDSEGNIKVINIGDMVLDSNVYYSVTESLTNCVNSNTAKTVASGDSYTATITANSGYTLSSVTVTMGGSAVSVTGGAINIASVTGDIVITAVAEEAAVEIINWIKEVGYTENTRLSLSGGNTTTASGYECSGFIPAKYGDVLYIENVDLTDENATNIIFYDEAKQPVKTNTTKNSHGAKLSYLFIGRGTQTGNGYSATLLAHGASIDALTNNFNYIRIGSKSITTDSVLNVN